MTSSHSRYSAGTKAGTLVAVLLCSCGNAYDAVGTPANTQAASWDSTQRPTSGCIEWNADICTSCYAWDFSTDTDDCGCADTSVCGQSPLPVNATFTRTVSQGKTEGNGVALKPAEGYGDRCAKTGDVASQTLRLLSRLHTEYPGQWRSATVDDFVVDPDLDHAWVEMADALVLYQGSPWKECKNKKRLGVPYKKICRHYLSCVVTVQSFSPPISETCDCLFPQAR